MKKGQPLSGQQVFLICAGIVIAVFVVSFMITTSRDASERMAAQELAIKAEKENARKEAAMTPAQKKKRTDDAKKAETKKQADAAAARAAAEKARQKAMDAYFARNAKEIERKAREQSADKGSGAWYEGGNLHKVSDKEWLAATEANRLATASDWAAKSKARFGFTDEAGMLAAATQINSCVTEAAKADAGQSAAELAAVCVMMLTK